MFVENRPHLAHTPRQQLLDELRERRVLLADGLEIPPIGERATDLAGILVGARQLRRHPAELHHEADASFLGFRERFVVERARKHHAQERVCEEFVARIRDHARGRDHVRDDGVVGERSSLRQPARDAGVEQRRFEPVADLVLAIEQCDVAPRVLVLVLIRANILDDPLGLGFVRIEADGAHGKRRCAIRVRRDPPFEDWRIELDQLSCERRNLLRTSSVVFKLNRVRDAEIVRVAPEDGRVRARPRVDRLFVIADGEDVPVLFRERADHAVLHWIQILEFVHEHDVESRAHLRCVVLLLEQLRRLDHERVEVDELSFRKKALVLVE